MCRRLRVRIPSHRPSGDWCLARKAERRHTFPPSQCDEGMPMRRQKETARPCSISNSDGQNRLPFGDEPASHPEYITLNEVTRVIPGRDGKRVSLVTVHRWCGPGLRGGLRLRTVKIGGRRYTTQVWVKQFIEGSSRDDRPTVESPPLRPPSRRQSASERAAAELEAAWGRKKK